MGKKINVDFIHVGFHKTASTWLQLYGYKMHPEVSLYNDIQTPLGKYFFQNFINIGDFDFNADTFLEKFHDLIELYHKNKKRICGICEENLSGLAWSGMGSKNLANRIKETFGETKILIIIRNQFDMFMSLYSNYLKGGGTKGLKSLLKNINNQGDFIFSKLCFHHLISYYHQLFGESNILVLPYEEMCINKNNFLNKIFSFIGVEPFEFEENVSLKRVNVKLSKPSVIIQRHLNSFGIDNKLFKKFISVSDTTIFKNWKHNINDIISFIPEEKKELWEKSNRITQNYLPSNLSLLGYKL